MSPTPQQNYYVAPNIIVSFYNGSTIVTGYAVQQTGINIYIVTDGIQYRTITITTDPVLETYCTGANLPPNLDYSIIENLGAIIGQTNSTGGSPTINVPPSPIVSNPLLTNITLSTTNFISGSPFVSSIIGSTESSIITATSSDGTLLRVRDGTVSGEYTTVGSFVITIIETLPGSPNSPHTNICNVSVSSVYVQPPVPATYDGAGFGWMDYTDLDIGNTVLFPANTPTVITRNLSCPLGSINNRLLDIYRGWDFWDNETNTVRAKLLYQMLYMSFYMQVVSDRSDGWLSMTLVTGSLTIASRAVWMTGNPGDLQEQRIDFNIPVRSSGFENGYSLWLTSNVPFELYEFSPEFYPGGHE